MLERSESPPAPEWIEAQCADFEGVLQAFIGDMRIAFRQKATEGRSRWDKPESAKELHDAAIAHLIAIPLAQNHEAHCANFMAFLWALRLKREGKPIAAGAWAPKGELFSSLWVSLDEICRVHQGLIEQLFTGEERERLLGDLAQRRWYIDQWRAPHG